MIILRFTDEGLEINTAKNARRFLRDNGLNVKQAIRREDNLWFFEVKAPERKAKRDEARAHEIHGYRYEYLEINSKTVKYICPVHGEKTQSTDNHFAGKGCRECGIESMRQKRYGPDRDWLDVKAQFIEVHGDEYDYSKSVFLGVVKKILIIHPACGREFWQKPSAHFLGKGCPSCGYLRSGQFSKAEKLVGEYFKTTDIECKAQEIFPTCRCRDMLPFDFYFPEINTLIEIHGIQHYEESTIFEESLGYRQYKDRIKAQWAKKQGIKLDIIRYDGNEDWVLGEVKRIVSGRLNSIGGI